MPPAANEIFGGRASAATARASREAQAHSLAAVVSLALLLLWPAAINRGAFLFPDTSTYVRGFDSAVVLATGIKTAWSGDDQESTNSAAKSATPVLMPVAKTPPSPRVVLSGRSVFYGALLYISYMTFGFAALAVVQALLVSAVVVIAFRQVASVSAGRLHQLFYVACLPVLSGLGVTCSFMMPDIFLSIAFISMLMISLFWTETKWSLRCFWVFALLCATLFHSANILIFGVFAIYLIAARRFLPVSLTVLPILAVVAGGVGGEMAFSAAVRAATGAAPVRPPFVTARLIADGPGRSYLAHACARGSKLTLCKYQSQIPEGSDAFLWSKNVGGFMGMPPVEQRRVAEEERGFVLGTLFYRPQATVFSSLRNFVDQIFRFKIDDVVDANTSGLDVTKLPHSLRTSFKKTMAASNLFPTYWLNWVSLWAYLVSSAFLVCVLVLGSRFKFDYVSRYIACSVISLVVVNSAVCGAISTPHDRYQSRILWLLPFFAIVMLIRRVNGNRGIVVST